MSSTTTYDQVNRLFNVVEGRGIVFPYFPMTLGQASGNQSWIDLDGTASTIQARFRLPMTAYLVTCEMWAVSDGQGLKTAAASIEPVVAINYGTAPLASVDAGTEIVTITCDATGDIGTKWSGGTTLTMIVPTQELIIHMKTQAGKGGGASGTVDGGAVPVLWFAAINAP
jgi:hypothetical protein